MLDPEQIRANYAAVASRVRAACERAGRGAGEVTIVAVSKTFPAEAATAAIAAGARDLGENRVQEARDKKPVVVIPSREDGEESGRGSVFHHPDSSPSSRLGMTVRWHLIGHLQSNKARDAVRIFDVIQTIDSVALAAKVGKAAQSAGKCQEVLLEVNIGREPQKAGADPADVESLAREVAKIDALAVTGLMTIPPVGDEGTARAYFRELRALRDATGLKHLSMGMTDDFEVAVEEGATIVRVGRAIFGSRG